MVKTIPVPLTKQEMDALIVASMDDEFYYLLFNVAKSTGRRLGEYLDVQVKNIRFDRGVMMTKILKRRLKVEREAILTPEVNALLQQYIKKNKLKEEDYIFRKESRRGIQGKVKKYAKKAGITHNVMFHNFRHYFITELYRKGYDYSKIAKLTGHASPAMLVRYDSSIASDFINSSMEDLRSL